MRPKEEKASFWDKRGVSECVEWIMDLSRAFQFLAWKGKRLEPLEI
jgi:hypothetical protein